MTSFPRGVLSVVVWTVLGACAPAPPTSNQTAEVAIAPAPPVASVARGDGRSVATTPRPDGVAVAVSGPTDEDRDRDPRMRRMPRAILAAEAEQLARLLEETPSQAPDHALLSLRTANAYGAFEAEAWRLGERDATEAARRTALLAYQRFLREYPKHPSAPEAMYFAGLEHERLQQVDQARKLWFRLIVEAPRHRLVPASYYAFGVCFRREAATDPSKLSLASQAFQEVVKNPESPLASRARAFLEEHPSAAP